MLASDVESPSRANACYIYENRNSLTLIFPRRRISGQKDNHRLSEKYPRGEERMSGHRELYDKVKKMVAKLYVLRDSCTGIIYSDKAGGNLSWFEGAEAILKEAVAELQEALLDLPLATSNEENDGKDLAKVEHLIRKLDNSTNAETNYS